MDDYDPIDEFHKHELLDRTYMMIEMFELVRCHRAAELVGDEEFEKVAGSLNKLYQTIAEKVLPHDK